MQINLPPALENMVKSMVAAGIYSSNSEMVCDALENMIDLHTLKKIKLDRLKKELQIGLNDIEHGNFATKTIDEIISEFKEKL